MKKAIRRLVCCAFLSIASIGCFDADARVTREVAEAVLPYLLEIAGLPQQQQTTAHISAIVRVLYTDAGQREIINWVEKGVFPSTLKWAFAPLIDLPVLTKSQKIKIRKVFPCQPSNSFSSYASNNGRVGWHTLNSDSRGLPICKNFILRNNTDLPEKVKDIVNIGDEITQNINSKLAAILFILDICDTADQIFNILDAQHATNPIAGYSNGTRGDRINAVYNEYDHRPVSAIAVNSGDKLEGDCVQTLYRHLINIAIQNDNTKLRCLNISHLPEKLKEYYTIRHGDANTSGIITLDITKTEAGLTELVQHQSWHNALIASLPHGTDITNGTIDNIVIVLGAIPVVATSVSDTTPRGYKAPSLNPVIQTSTGSGGMETNQQANATAIQDALNTLDGRCSIGDKRFIVSVTDNMSTSQVTKIKDKLPDGANLIIQIADRLWGRTITIGITSGGHAEIVSIEM